jgi:cytidylate kinase
LLDSDRPSLQSTHLMTPTPPAPPPLIIAIDGPAGAGKSATARALALRLGIPYVDTGAMYRVIALAAMRAGISCPLDAAGEARLAELARAVAIRFVGEARGQRVMLGDEDVTAELRDPRVSQGASIVSAVPAVRREMVTRQRELVHRDGGVIEGRDIGTVVFPDATLKVFLTAAPEVRARRRLDELRARGLTARFEDVLAEQRERDFRDSTRSDSPLRPADGAIVLDNSSLTLADVVARVLALLSQT